MVASELIININLVLIVIFRPSNLITDNNKAELPLPPGIMSLKISDNSPTKYEVGQPIKVDIKIDSADKLIIGVDCIIKFDENKMEINSLIGTNEFSIYPISSIKDGSIKISGLMQPGSTKSVNGVALGSFILTPKQKGELALNIDFKPFSTTESNIVEGISGSDVLGKVEDLIINIY
jgi:hypothetical protein